MRKIRFAVSDGARPSSLDHSLHKAAPRNGGTKIEWADYTFNPWWGCQKVSAACDNCYADQFAIRVGQEVWGKDAPRRFFGDTHWASPMRWNAEAQAEGTRLRVFCASMADVFEGRRDLDADRARLWQLIEATPNLDWLLLTKRPQNIMRMTLWGDGWPDNVWIGTTVENQKTANKRLPFLVTVPAAVRFISAEPLFSALDLAPWINQLDWVISGGESGGGSRPSVPAHFRQLRDQCVAADVAFLFKQWGDFAPDPGTYAGGKKTVVASDGTRMVRLTKKAAGRSLDGKTWDQFPIPRRRG